MLTILMLTINQLFLLVHRNVFCLSVDIVAKEGPQWDMPTAGFAGEGKLLEGNGDVT
jgi:hypothetical protein